MWYPIEFFLKKNASIELFLKKKMLEIVLNLITNDNL